ncbi:histidine kinase [Bdellovibrio bacteriovorus]|uniref:histidine kinase n=1 Tax=Bdellovibrio bacteriovorus TaxID=959 RepID=A0A150WWQ3_BDEBC|nr:histidine kinase [Bdellovibrio bacteriovorus]
MLFASVVAIFLSQINLDYLEAYLYDLRIRTTPTTATSGNVELVLFNQESAQKLKSDLSASVLSNIIKKVRAENPKHILVAVSLEDISGDTAAKHELAKTASETKNLVVITDELELRGEENGLSLPAPFQEVRVASGPRTADSKAFAKDGVTRRMLIAYQDKPLLHAQLAAEINRDVKDLSSIQGQFEYAGSIQTYIHFHPAKTYPSHSAIELLEKSSAGNAFENKIIIIGDDTALKNSDYILTPYSREPTAMPIAEMHANMLDTIVLNASPRVPPKWFNFVIIWLISVLTVHVVLTMSPAKGLIVLVGTVLGFSILSYAAFAIGNLWIGMAAPILSIFLCYYFFIPYRLIVENRRSWEYYQKNKLLSQVEELKTNFISMMSHDLKTPIARIQGMTDMILADPVTLSPQQREAVDTIRHSSDDLLKFINAILNYGKIESQGVQLNLQSKDINNLLQEVIRKHEFLAKVKRIQIVSELEPMFPVPVDADLMKQVFSNLVENAIKYSPEDTKIMISSEESSTKVVVQVADQGPGIPADELPNIFMKFFRSKNAKSSPIKGSGLGLYLAKYFTELHHGRLFVESSHGNGSTFTVELPIEQGGTHA